MLTHPDSCNTKRVLCQSPGEFTFHVHLGGLCDFLIDNKLWQCFEERRGGMNEHCLIHERRL